MSRIGKRPIPVPSGVQVSIDDATVSVEGPKGKLSASVPGGVSVSREGDDLVVTRPDDSRESRAYHGLTRKLVANMVQGVSDGFQRVLEIHGVGYRAEARGDALHLSLGFSHPIVFQLPEGVTAKVDKQTVVTLEGADTQVLGHVAAMIRGLRPPEPYKGKGVRYLGERVRRKSGKAAGS